MNRWYEEIVGMLKRLDNNNLQWEDVEAWN
jgi:hypothetical protein